MKQYIDYIAKRIGYIFLIIIISCRNLWLSIGQKSKDIWHACIDSCSSFHSMFRRIARVGTQRGTSPKQPTTLAAILLYPHRGDQDDQAICRLLVWYVPYQDGFHSVCSFFLNLCSTPMNLNIIKKNTWSKLK